MVTFDIKLAAWLILIEAIQQRASIHKIPIILYMQKLILWMQSCVEHKDLHKTLWNFIQTPNYSVVPPVTMITGCTEDTDWLLSLRFQSPSTFQYRKCSVNLWRDRPLKKKMVPTTAFLPKWKLNCTSTSQLNEWTVSGDYLISIKYFVNRITGSLIIWLLC